MINNIQKPREQKEVSKKSKSRINTGNVIRVTSLALSLLLSMSGTTKFQNSLTTKCGELTEGMKELGSKAVDAMLKGLEKTVDAIGPTSAYAGGNPDELRRKDVDKEIDDIFGDTKEGIKKADERNKSLDKEIERIHHRNARLQILNDNIPFLSDIVSGKINSSDPKNKAKWRESREKILKNLDELSPELQIDVKNNISIADKKMGI